MEHVPPDSTMFFKGKTAIDLPDDIVSEIQSRDPQASVEEYVISTLRAVLHNTRTHNGTERCC